MSNIAKCWMILFVCAFIAHVPAAEKKKKPDPILDKSSELKKDDDKDTRLTKSPAKVFRVTLTGGARYQIDLKSKAFDAYLRLLDTKDNEVAFNDDADIATFDSRIVYQPAKTGDFKIVITSLDGKAGKFSIFAIEVDAKTPLLTGSRFVTKAIPLKLSDGKATYKGELTETDGTAHKRAYKLFKVEVEQDKTYRIEAHAADPKTLDASIILEGAGGLPIASDRSSGKEANPRLTYKAAKSGIHRVIVTTTRESQTGRFTLDIAPAADAKKDKKN